MYDWKFPRRGIYRDGSLKLFIMFIMVAGEHAAVTAAAQLRKDVGPRTLVDKQWPVQNELRGVRKLDTQVESKSNSRRLRLPADVYVFKKIRFRVSTRIVRQSGDPVLTDVD